MRDMLLSPIAAWFYELANRGGLDLACEMAHRATDPEIAILTPEEALELIRYLQKTEA